MDILLPWYKLKLNHPCFLRYHKSIIVTMELFGNLRMHIKNFSFNIKFFKSIVHRLPSYQKSLLEIIKKKKHQLHNLIDTNYQLGLFHLNANNMNDAEFRFRLVLYFQPTHYEALYNLAKCLITKKKTKSAIKKLNKAIELKHDFLEAKYLLSIINKSTEIEAIPLSVIKEYYDSIAHEYNKKFSTKNGYKLPQHVSDLLCTHLDLDQKYDVLDIGCGTGKCGHDLAKKLKTTSLIGVDISKHMLEEAQKHTPDTLCPFDKLINLDYMEFLTKTEQKFDVILAVMSLHFHKNLEKTLELIQDIMRPKGYIAFVVEKSPDTTKVKLDSNYENFCYTEKYIKDSAKQSKLTIISLDELLLSNGKTVLVAVCTK